MSISVIDAGRKGGLAVLSKKGHTFYSDIGKKGQQETRRKHPGMASEWGRLGGRPKKPALGHTMGEEGK